MATAVASGADLAAGRLARRERGGLLSVPATLLVVVFLLLPLVLMFRYSLNRFVPGQFMVEALTVENYVKFVQDPFYKEVLLTTVWVAGLSTLVCLLAGLPAAYFIARTESRRLKAALIMIVVLPLLMGNAVRTAGWLVILGERGVVNALLLFLGITEEPFKLMYTPGAVVVALISVLLPFMIITLQSVIEGIDRSIEEASLNLGAPPLRTFFRVIVPIAMPGVFAGTLLCFILAMNAYATPVLVGGPTFHMMAPKVYEQIAKANNWPFGAALSFVLMTVTLVLTILASATVHRRSRT